MAFESNFITFVGNLTDDPELRFTGGGTPVATLRVASNRRWTGRDGQQQEETTFMNVNAWRDLAENASESLSKGDRVVVIGRVKVRSYENKENQTVWVTEIEADEIAPSLRWAKASAQRTNRSDSSSNDGGSSNYNAPPPADEDVPF
ncbi:MAG: single-stranded DNA-binding protein [Nitriliruptor sp.]|nr:MAG: single-stranded DNA-binding protein [Nitriliruptor sp.]